MMSTYRIIAAGTCGLAAACIAIAGVPCAAQALGHPVFTLAQIEKQYVVHNITLHANGESVDALLARISARAGVAPFLGPVSTSLASVDVVNATYWEAVDAVERAGNGVPRDPPAFPLQKASVAKRCGPVDIVLQGSWRVDEAALDLTAGQVAPAHPTDDIHLTFLVRVDPRIPHPTPNVTVRNLRATDEYGASLVGPPDIQGRIERPYHGRGEYGESWEDDRLVGSMQIPLVPTARGRHIATLGGIATIPVWATQETWSVEVPNTAISATKEIKTHQGPVVLTATSDAKLGSGALVVTLACLGDTRPQPEIGTTTMRRAMLIGHNGTILGISNRPTNTPKWPCVTYSATILVPADQKDFFPARLTWSVPTSLGFLEIPFEFTDIAIP